MSEEDVALCLAHKCFAKVADSDRFCVMKEQIAEDQFRVLQVIYKFGGFKYIVTIPEEYDLILDIDDSKTTYTLLRGLYCICKDECPPQFTCFVPQARIKDFAWNCAFWAKVYAERAADWAAVAARAADAADAADAAERAADWAAGAAAERAAEAAGAAERAADWAAVAAERAAVAAERAAKRAAERAAEWAAVAAVAAGDADRKRQIKWIVRYCKVGELVEEKKDESEK